MPIDLFRIENTHTLVLENLAGSPRTAPEIARELEELKEGSYRLESTTALGAPRMLAVLQALRRPIPHIILPIPLASIQHKGLIDSAARAGCIALQLQREELLDASLGNGLLGNTRERQALALSLRRIRGLGMATIMDFDLGRPGDDEGVFERTYQFIQDALIAIPRIRATTGIFTTRMTKESLQNGLRWTSDRINRHHAIWRRALWPSGRIIAILRAGYQQRATTPTKNQGHYSAGMKLLKILNLRRKTSQTKSLLTLSATPLPSARRGWMEVRAAADAQRHILEVRIAGSLDLHGARKVLTRVSQALQEGIQLVTIDFADLEAVSPEVIHRFAKENHAHFMAMAGRAKVLNLQSSVDALRRQLGNTEAVQRLAATLPV